MKNSYKKVEFNFRDLSEKAFEVYSNSDFVFYKDDEKDLFLVADNNRDVPYEVGTIEAVEEYLLQFAD